MDLNMRTPRLIYFKAFVQGDTTAFKRESTSIQRATGATGRAITSREISIEAD